MRVVDLARLSEPYPEALEPTEEDARSAVGVRLPNWSSLESEVLADFVEDRPYGIGWWAPGPGATRRILIADQLWCCLSSVMANMTEASLHWLEYLDALDRDTMRLADALKLRPNGPVLELPRPNSAFEQLLPDLIRMHQAGVVRAVASSLDCLAGVIIGVVALPQSILKADFTRARNLLARIDGAKDGGKRAQADFAERLEQAIAGSGPPGWLEWVLDLRNMLVHRGRRTELGQFIPMTPVLFGPDGRPIPRVRRVSHLPRDPGRSDMEVFLDKSWDMVLHEDETWTLRGIMNSTTVLLETAAEHLLHLWRWRRTSPDALCQPAEQWKDGPATRSTGFGGYAPNSLPFEPDIGTVHPLLRARIHAAALNDAARVEWENFD